MNRRIMIGVVLALALSLSLLGTALAHAELVSSTPAAGSKLATAPSAITLVFSEEIDEQGSSFSVMDAKQAKVGGGMLDLNDLDHKTLAGTLNAGLADGVYTVAWEVITSEDQAKESGTFTFGVNADPGAQPTAQHDEATATPAAAATPTAAASGGAARPTPTAAAGGTPPTSLPSTGANDTGLLAFALVAALLLLAGGMALYRSRAGLR